MPKRQAAGTYLLIAFVIGLSNGCYQSPETTWYKPHVYKGGEDPLLDKLQSGGLQPALAERFQIVQTDR